jgi:hypothetical protein
MPKGIKRITDSNGGDSKLPALLDALIALDDSSYALLVDSAIAGRELRFKMEAIRAKLG